MRSILTSALAVLLAVVPLLHAAGAAGSRDRGAPADWFHDADARPAAISTALERSAQNAGSAEVACESLRSSCCGEGCTCEPGNCPCRVEAPPSEPATIPVPPRSPCSGSDRLQLPPALPASVPPTTIADDARSSARAVVASDRTDRAARSARAILLQSGILRN